MRIFTDDEKTMIIQMYLSGNTQDEIRKKLRCRSTTLTSFLRENGYGKRPYNMVNEEALKNSRKYYFNVNYFDEINTETKAYWLGFLYADGNVYIQKGKNGQSKGGRVEISLQESDMYHLKKLLNDISADDDFPIDKKTTQLNDKTYISYRVLLNSIDMCKQLIAHGCVPQKSLILKPPNIDDKLICHFIRGYFDGDGCVSYNSINHNSIANILGTKEIIEYIRDKSGILSKNIRCLKNGITHSLYFDSNSDLVIFYNYIYNDASVYLDRKKDKYDQFIDYIKKHKCELFVNAMSDDHYIKYKKRGIPVVGISKDLSDIRIYESASQACREMSSETTILSHGINNCCRLVQKTSFGYYWMYYKDYIIYKDKLYEYVNNVILNINK